MYYTHIHFTHILSIPKSHRCSIPSLNVSRTSMLPSTRAACGWAPGSRCASRCNACAPRPRAKEATVTCCAAWSTRPSWALRGDQPLGGGGTGSQCEQFAAEVPTQPGILYASSHAGWPGAQVLLLEHREDSNVPYKRSYSAGFWDLFLFRKEEYEDTLTN